MYLRMFMGRPVPFSVKFPIVNKFFTNKMALENPFYHYLILSSGYSQLSILIYAISGDNHFQFLMKARCAEASFSRLFSSLFLRKDSIFLLETIFLLILEERVKLFEQVVLETGEALIQSALLILLLLHLKNSLNK